MIIFPRESNWTNHVGMSNTIDFFKLKKQKKKDNLASNSDSTTTKDTAKQPELHIHMHNSLIPSGSNISPLITFGPKWTNQIICLQLLHLFHKIIWTSLPPQSTNQTSMGSIYSIWILWTDRIKKIPNQKKIPLPTGTVSNGRHPFDPQGRYMGKD